MAMSEEDTGSPDTQPEEDEMEESLQCTVVEPTDYRRCAMGTDLSTFLDFRKNVTCESFIATRAQEEQYEYMKSAPRKEVLAIAVAMNRMNGHPVPFVSADAYVDVYSDLRTDTLASWIMPVVETGLEYGLVSKERSLFEPDRDVTRAEAFAMMMDAVCMESRDLDYDTWEQRVHARALTE